MPTHDELARSLSDEAMVIRNEVGLVLFWAKYDQTVRDCLRNGLDAIDVASRSAILDL